MCVMSTRVCVCTFYCSLWNPIKSFTYLGFQIFHAKSNKYSLSKALLLTYQQWWCSLLPSTKLKRNIFFAGLPFLGYFTTCDPWAAKRWNNAKSSGRTIDCTTNIWPATSPYDVSGEHKTWATQALRQHQTKYETLYSLTKSNLLKRCQRIVN
jgi:hypothetical protein